MFDSVIITLRTEDNSFISDDLDMPCKEPLNDLTDKLLEILRIFDNRLFSGWNDIKFTDERTNKQLNPEESLEEAGIWDGSVLIIKN